MKKFPSSSAGDFHVFYYTRIMSDSTAVHYTDLYVCFPLMNARMSYTALALPGTRSWENGMLIRLATYIASLGS